MQLSLNNRHVGYLTVSLAECPQQMISSFYTSGPNWLFIRKSFRSAPSFDQKNIGYFCSERLTIISRIRVEEMG